MIFIRDDQSMDDIRSDWMGVVCQEVDRGYHFSSLALFLVLIWGA